MKETSQLGREKYGFILHRWLAFISRGLTGRSHAERGSVKKEKYQGLGPGDNMYRSSQSGETLT